MCVLMVMCFMPTAAFAEGESNVTIKDVNGNEQTIEAVSVDTADALTTAVDEGKNVILTADITLSAPLEIKKSVAIVGNNHTISTSSGTRVINVNENTSDIKFTLSNVKIDASELERGISIYGNSNVTIILDKCEITADHYAVNMAGYNTNPKVVVRNSTLTGYSAFQTWSANTSASFENCTLNGVNKWSGSQDDYATIVVVDGATDSTLTFKNCNISETEQGTAKEYLFSIRESATVTVTGDGTINGELIDEGTITITGGTFNADPTAYVANGYITKKNSDTEYVVVAKNNLGTGTYMANPEGSLASRCYVGDTDNETYWTVYRYSSSSSSSSSTTKTDSVTNTTETTKTESGATEAKAETKATVSAETKTAADGTKTTTATVDTTTATKIVEKAVENKSEEVVVTAAATPVAETAAGTTTEVAIPAETVSQIAEKTTAAVTIESEAAKVTLDQEAVAAVAETAGEAGTVSLVVETKAQDENKVEVELKLETSNGAVSDFKGGTVSVTVKLNAALAAKPVMCVYIDDNGVYHKVAGQKNADGTYTFQTGHFSTYAILPEEEADAVIANQAATAKDYVKALSLKASSTKTKKGNIKVTLKVDSDEIKAIEDLGYTVKYKFYRSTKKASGYKAKFETAGKTYTNTTGKKGTRYYYKARVMVYDSEGTLVTYTALKQCKFATRIK